ncbi:hypothetical protein [Paraburkholderia hospita]|uniref:hypothetical protein n=1 Tax=Paraburkholderia hospita TaxID=169430 RepID=UPI0008A723D4|nr:hypothetical protein [Paraburkholderia hospita]SEI14744.1 hypothetical protein SAMN05192544_1025102 [Paraburkholderia hospita]
MEATTVVLPVNIPMYTASIPDLDVAILGGDDFGSLPSEPGGFEIVANKVINRGEYRYTQPDGQLRLTCSDILVTVTRYRSKRNGADTFWTGAQAAFTQYNNTQNDKGTHDAFVKMVFKNAAGGPQGIIYPRVTITRDVCRLIGRITCPQVYSGKDVFDLVQSVDFEAVMNWNYEGGC